MRTITYQKDTLLQLITKKTIVTLAQLKKELGTQSTMTIFRKLKELTYITSYSHGGKYYTLRRLAQFKDDGIWEIKSVLF